MRLTTGQRVAKSIPLIACLVGMTVIMGSVTVFFDDTFRRVIGITAGIFLLLMAVWYAANPFFFSTRRYLQLRTEVVRFIALVRDLNNAVVAGAGAGEVEQARSELHNAIDRIVNAAGKTGKYEVHSRDQAVLAVTRHDRQ